MRAKAIAEAPAAKAQTEYDKLLAEKEAERRYNELEEQSLANQHCAQYEKEMALLRAERVAAIADAKLEAIKRSLADDGESQAAYAEKRSHPP